MRVRFSLILGLIAVFVVGLVFGGAAFGGVTTTTMRETVTVTSPITSILTSVSERTVENIVSKTVTASVPVTVTATDLKTVTATITKTQSVISTITMTRNIYPPESLTVMVTDSGSGSKETRPFTLNETSDLKITVTINPTADLEWVSFSWFLYDLNKDTFIKYGDVREEAGSFEFYAAKIPPGDYYVKILAANCKWQIKVEKAEA